MAKAKYIPIADLSPEAQEKRRARGRAKHAKHRTKLNARQLERKWARIDEARLADAAAHRRARAANPEKHRAASRASHHKHKAQRNQDSREYLEAHREDLNAKSRVRSAAHYLANIPRYAARARLWRKNNRVALRAIEARRRARKRGAPVNDFTAAEWRALCKATGYTCAYCHKKFPFKELTQDHITPLSKGGSHTLANIIPACKSCNSRKNAKDVPTPVQPFLLVEAAVAD